MSLASQVEALATAVGVEVKATKAGGIATPTLNGVVLGNTNGLKVTAAAAVVRQVLVAPSLGSAPYFGYIDFNYMPAAWAKVTVWQASTENHVLSGVQDVDGQPGYSGFRYLIRCQTDPIENGIYQMADGVWTRTIDANFGTKLLGCEVPVVGGLTLAGSRWTTNFDPNQGDVIDVTPMNWFRFSEQSAALVHKTGDETVAGVKTFTDGIALPAPLPVEQGGTGVSTPFDIATAMGIRRGVLSSGDHVNLTTVGTKVDLGGAVGLETGSYLFDYYLMVQSSSLTVSPMYGVNFTGTATVGMWMTYADQSATLLAMLNKAAAQTSAALGFQGAQAQNAFSTVAPNMGHTVGGVGAINTDILIRISGLLIVTMPGDLELWHSSETNASTTIKAGSVFTTTKF